MEDNLTDAEIAEIFMGANTEDEAGAVPTPPLPEGGMADTAMPAMPPEGMAPEGMPVPAAAPAAAPGAIGDPRVDALVQQMAAQRAGIDELVAVSKMSAEQSKSAIDGIMNPQPKVSPEEAWLETKIQGYTTPLMQTIEGQKAVIESLQAKAREDAEAAFVAKQKDAITQTKAMFPDFVPAEAASMMQPYIAKLTALGMAATTAERVVMEQFGTPDGLAMLWKAKKYDRVAERAKTKQPDMHVPSGNTAQKPTSVMDALNSEDKKVQADAINQLWGAK